MTPKTSDSFHPEIPTITSAASSDPRPSAAETLLTPADPADEPPSQGRRIRILLADHNVDTRESNACSLREFWTVELAGNGESALTSIQVHKPDLVIADVLLPGLDGSGLLRELRNNPATRSIPVILTSGQPREQSRSKEGHSEAVDYLVAPFTESELVARVQANVALLQLRREIEQRKSESEERMHLAMEAGGMATWDADLKTGKAIWSESLFRLLGYQPHPEGAASYANWFCRIHPDDRDYMARAVDQARRNRSLYNPEYRIIRADTGETGWLSSAGRFSYDQAGEAVRFAGFVFDITERKNAEIRVRDSEERLRLAAQTSGFGIHDYDSQTDRSVWSPQMYSILGLPRTTEIRMATVIETIHPEDRQRVAALMQAALDSEGTGEFAEEFRVRRADTGETRWLYNRSRTVFTGDGTERKAVRNTGIVLDITDRKRAEDELRRSEERVRIAQQAARSGTWEWNLQTGKAVWSPEQESIYGLSPGGFSGDIEQWRGMVNPKDLAAVENAVPAAIENRTEYHVKFRITRADGAARWIESFARVFYDEDGKPARMIGVNADITERTITEEALQQSELRSRRLIESNIIPVLYANEQIITEANDVFLRLVGYTREEMAEGKIDWVKMTPPEHLPKDFNALEQVKSKGFCVPFEKEYLRKDGSRVPILLGATALTFSPLECVCFVLDLSDLKRVEAELRKSHEDLEQKVADRTRELAQSLAVVKSEVVVRTQTEAQLRELSARVLRLQDEERRRIARDLHDSTGQTLAAIKMSLAALETLVAKVPDAVGLVNDLNALADQAVQEIRTTSHLLHPPLLDEVGFSSAARWHVEGLAQRSGIRTRLDLSPGIRLTKAAELALFRVLQESLTNVLRHSGSSAADVRLYCEGETAVLSIRDYGTGIASEKLQSLIQTGAGVGVGLGGMKQRIRDLGGHLRVESNGTGTAVLASLPLDKSSGDPDDNSQAAD